MPATEEVVSATVDWRPDPQSLLLARLRLESPCELRQSSQHPGGFLDHAGLFQGQTQKGFRIPNTWLPWGSIFVIKRKS